jgi:excisionase family DNA binding protein
MQYTDGSIKLLTPAQAASILKISRRTLDRMIKNGQMPAIKIGCQWRILESRFEEWVQQEAARSFDGLFSTAGSEVEVYAKHP